ncbi:MAG TPA: hypothetical protein VN914_10155 [Polyangia bacterium]|nr:hypothetical protein [Polyangia bacterium]
MLQALNEFTVKGTRLLDTVDYLATVSGGGYIGGWWMAVRRAVSTSPTIPADSPRSEPLRHLREFSRFLSPRWGVFQQETWGFLATLWASMVVSLLAMCCLLILLTLAWHLVASTTGAGPVPGWIAGHASGWWSHFIDAWPPPAWLEHIGSAPALLVCTIALQGVGEMRWRRTKRTVEADLSSPWFWSFAVLAALSAAGIGILVRSWWCNCRAVGDWESFLVFLPAAAWLGAAAVGALLRLCISRGIQHVVADPKVASDGRPHRWLIRRNALDRCTARLLFSTVAWLVLALLWTVAIHIQPIGKALIASATTAGATGLVTWALSQFKKISTRKAPTEDKASSLRPWVPVVLSYLTLALAVLGAFILVHEAVARHWHLGLAIGAATFCLFTVLVFSPNQAGLHASYRARIARAYLGKGTVSDEVQKDDFSILELSGRPIHLICCAANDLGGDPLERLGRGARSAVLSAHGLSVGQRWVRWEEVGTDPWAQPPSYASALTASAAAFNSSMGSVSVQLGPAVGVLMTALNLRLGLWIVGSTAKWWRRFPGMLLALEAFGWTRTPNNEPQTAFKAVHLSDGGHFENTGLYELVRRHCRYIVLSDCGQDETVVFDDVANAIRKVRQDFGVEIVIDLSPLKPGPDGLSRQHVVVGDIIYPRAEIAGAAPARDESVDRGVLVLVKPTITGDEPGDVLQYRSRNRAFPHESTGDQFYDNEQWEAYRRLGKHVVDSALRGGKRLADEHRSIANVFSNLRFEWYPTPPDLERSFLELTERNYDIENTIRETAPPFLAAELLGELTSPMSWKEPPASFEDWRKVVHILAQVLQLMEDVWIGCKLDTLWNHPLNLGWMNYFNRWARTPTFRMWWPVLKMQQGPGFIRFAEEQLELPGTSAANLKVGDVKDDAPRGLAERCWRNLKRKEPGPGALPRKEPNKFVELILTLEHGELKVRVQVGLLAYALEDGEAQWDDRDFFIVPGLWGSGLGGQFMTLVKTKLAGTPCRVSIVPARSAGAGVQQERADLVQFYQSHDFFSTDPKNPLVLSRRF